MHAVLTRQDSCSVLRLSGRIAVGDSPSVRDSVAQAVTARTDALVCDVSAVTALDPACLEVLTAVPATRPWRAAGVWLVGARPQVSRTLEPLLLGDTVRTARSVEEALRQAGSRTPVLQDRLATCPSPFASRRARQFTLEVCDGWQIGHVGERAAQIASELVTNAMQHAGTDLELCLEFDGSRLCVAVRDEGPGLSPACWDWDSPRDADVAAMPEHGRGLHVVRALADEVGAHSERGRGAAVWAVLATSPEDVAATPEVRESVLVPVRTGSGTRRTGARARRMTAATRLGFNWDPARPDAVTLTLASVPAHPVLPSGEWVVPRRALERGLSERTESGDVVVAPTGVVGVVEFGLPVGSRRRTIRVPVRRVGAFLRRLPGARVEEA